ncbi:acetoacetate--CoA ligase [Methylocystis bryophila]|uniref:Acetoacetate--CoA ligase n=1 Tax=Methylocystis bryophila TaxID=655015 RepID=A0A1W6N1J6_9HYPH|nr:acetoacetate--CoA ligase [Methylocystis bryophila]ARN83724.1 acetoacetate--CoA ligase [Methylocystis bryophila]BDV38571.1 acetoacetyl-coenzyme A synthetase [Methylocystis bryophila]
MSIVWSPDPAQRASARLTAFARSDRRTEEYAETFDYAGLHVWSLGHSDAFWSRLWDFFEIIGEKGGTVLADGDKMPGARWFPQARLNFAQNLLRQRAASEIAIVFQGEKRERRTLTFGELKRQVGAIAAYLRSAGVGPGDRVAGYLHNGPEAVVGMLAAASLGAVWASCSPDFGVAGVLDRFGQIGPKALIACDGYFYKGQACDRLEQAREIAAGLSALRAVLVAPYIHDAPSLKGFAMAELWPDVLAKHDGAPLDFALLPFDHPLYVVFSSGTTGSPKCIVHGAGGCLLQHMKEHQLHCDVRPGDRVFFATTTGWMMWNWLVSALASRATILLYDGFPMDRNGAALFDLAEREHATLFGVSAGFLRAAQKLGVAPARTHDLASMRLLASTGSPLSPEGFDYVYRDVAPNAQLASMSGGTDILSCFVLGNSWRPVIRGEIQGAGLGMAVEVWNDDGARIVGAEGELVCTQPFPSMPIEFWNDPGGEKYKSAYFSDFANIWRHGDFATETPSGGFIIHGRSDATLNPQGVRIGTAEIYRIVEAFMQVEECLAVCQDASDGQRILLFVKLRAGERMSSELSAGIKHRLREEASPRHVPAAIIEAPELPHTRSGKLVELAVRDVVHGRPVKNREALANPESLDFFAQTPRLAPP